ncbi:Purine catabolism protein PucB [Pseudomonas fluorescens]|uniref:nucleotidyltransferase family protein n=1 Tax=Pseudomonas fluorescens TaxID=294 RepID=UPI00125418D6|nr:nucleotidyltransferase family protein [Pseudomonas fluorescens]CAG8863573.1 Purine catabolism protein PucB [Pseudomonas fluorescens]VVP84794.1 Purine catabolism protein PucB [Pseudomonas fluorescens]
MTSNVAALMLAAGYSRRFGSDKRQHCLDDGQTLLDASLVLPCATLDEVWLVLRPDDSRPLSLPAAVQVVQSTTTRLGLAHSIAAGVSEVAQVSPATALAIFLADMPFITTATLDALLATSDAAHICVPTYHGRPGHPVVFGRSFWPELRQLAGDSGAREVLQRHAHAVRRVAVDDPGILLDIDRPSDLPRGQQGLD